MPRKSPHGRKVRGPKNGRWKGGKTLTERGWVRIYSGRRRGQYEHTVVWERHHKKKVPPGYEIHHKDGVPWHNEVQNLQKIKKSKHSRISSERSKNGVQRRTVYDLTPADFKYLEERGVSIPPQFDVPF